MVVTGIIAFLMVVLAYVAQSPRFLKKIGLGGYRLDLRVRSFTGYALAFMLLSFGFFLAGVPLGPQLEPPPATPVVEVTPQLAQTAVSDAISDPTNIAEAIPTSPSNGDEAADEQADSSSSTGFGGALPTAEPEAEPEEEAVEEATLSPTVAVENEPLADSTATIPPTVQSSATPSPTPTETAVPTFTPTPIVGEVATIGTGTSTLWLRRTPGGQDFVLVMGGDIVILMPGHANQGGVLWHEVSTLDGITAWVQESYLNIA